MHAKPQIGLFSQIIITQAVVQQMRLLPKRALEHICHSDNAVLTHRRALSLLCPTNACIACNETLPRRLFT